MELDQNKLSPEETPGEFPCHEEEPPKHKWQQTKENWYDHLTVTVKQLDIIIGVAVAGLVLVGIMIALDAMGVF